MLVSVTVGSMCLDSVVHNNDVNYNLLSGHFYYCQVLIETRPIIIVLYIVIVHYKELDLVV